MSVKFVYIFISFLCTGSSKKMDGIWNRYNLKSTRWIYTFGVLKMFRKVWSFRPTLVHFNMCTVCSSGDVQTKFCLLSLFWIMSRVTVSMADVILSCRCWIFLIFSTYTMFLMYPHRKKIKWREIWASRWPGYWSIPSNPGIRESLI